MDAQTVDLYILTRFSILSEKLPHSWGIFGKHTKLLRKLLPPKPQPTLDQRRAYLFDHDRLTYRFRTFETLLLASLAAQDDSRFRHVVFTSEQLPDWASTRLDGLQDKHGFTTLRLDTQTNLEEGLQAWNPAPVSGATHTATMRIDDDDALSRISIAEVHAQSYKAEDTVLTWPEGIYLTDRGKGRFAIRRINRPFRACGLTRIRRGTEPWPSIYSLGRHKTAGQNHPVITLPTKDAFLMSVHPDNVSGRKPRRGDADLTDADRALLLTRFGICIEGFGEA